MSERTTSRVIPRLGPEDSIPLLTEVIELPAEVPLRSARTVSPPDAVVDTAGMAPTGLVTQVGDTGGAELEPLEAAELAEPAGPSYQPEEDELRAVRTELLTRVMMRFRAEWPQVVEAHTEAALQSWLAPLTAQLTAELTRSLEARLVEWLDATLEEIERDPGGV